MQCPVASSSSRTKWRSPSASPKNEQLARCSAARMRTLSSAVRTPRYPSSTPLAPPVSTTTAIGLPLSRNQRIVTPMASKSSGCGARASTRTSDGKVERLRTTEVSRGRSVVGCLLTSGQLFGRLASMYESRGISDVSDSQRSRHRRSAIADQAAPRFAGNSCCRVFSSPQRRVLMGAFTVGYSSAVAEIQGLYGAFSFAEKLLQKIWLRGDFNRAGAVLSDGRRLKIVHPGKWNLLGGPD